MERIVLGAPAPGHRRALLALSLREAPEVPELFFESPLRKKTR